MTACANPACTLAARPGSAWCSDGCKNRHWKAENAVRVRDQAREGYHRRKAERAEQERIRRRQKLIEAHAAR